MESAKHPCQVIIIVSKTLKIPVYTILKQIAKNKSITDYKRYLLSVILEEEFNVELLGEDLDETDLLYLEIKIIKDFDLRLSDY